MLIPLDPSEMLPKDYLVRKVSKLLTALKVLLHLRPKSKKGKMLMKEVKKPTDNQTKTIAIIFIILIIFGFMNLCGVFDTKKSSSTVSITPTSIPIQIPGWDDVDLNTLCIDISQDYPEEWFGFFKATLVKLGMDISPKQYVFPFDTVTNDIMQKIGLQVVEKEAPCEAKLTIIVKGREKVATYGKFREDKCYTGSYVTVKIALSYENTSYETIASGQNNPPSMITSGNCPTQAYQAPFAESSAEALTKALVDIWGPEIATIIRKNYRMASDDVEKAMYSAAKDFLDNQVDYELAEPFVEPTKTPVP